MHVEVSNISKAIVNPYLGKEIPKYKELGLDPGRIYQLLRDPAELKKAESTFNINLPLLDQHVGVNAANHRPGARGRFDWYRRFVRASALEEQPRDLG